MTNELIALAKILPEIATYLEGLDNTEDAETVRKATAALRKMAEQKPVECNPADYCVAQHIKCYAAPVAADPEFVAEAMRLADEMVAAATRTKYMGREHFTAAKAALQAHLEGRTG